MLSYDSDIDHQSDNYSSAEAEIEKAMNSIHGIEVDEQDEPIVSDIEMNSNSDSNDNIDE